MSNFRTQVLQQNTMPGFVDETFHAVTIALVSILSVITLVATI